MAKSPFYTAYILTLGRKLGIYSSFGTLQSLIQFQTWVRSRVVVWGVLKSKEAHGLKNKPLLKFCTNALQYSPS